MPQHRRQVTRARVCAMCCSQDSATPELSKAGTTWESSKVRVRVLVTHCHWQHSIYLTCRISKSTQIWKEIVHPRTPKLWRHMPVSRRSPHAKLKKFFSGQSGVQRNESNLPVLIVGQRCSVYHSSSAPTRSRTEVVAVSHKTAARVVCTMRRQRHCGQWSPE